MYINDLDPAMVATVLASYNVDPDNTCIAYLRSGTMTHPAIMVGLMDRKSGSSIQDKPAVIFPTQDIHTRSGAIDWRVMAEIDLVAVESV